MPPESRIVKTRRAEKCIRLLKKEYPDAKCSLDFGSVHELMVATILSAQCTDERVNLVTPALFEKYPSVRAFAESDRNVLGKDIFSTGFHNNKSKAIKASAQQLLERHDGQVPKTLKELVQLTGVGRKTASVILGAGFGLAEGVVVDTHVGRISRLLKFTAEKDPNKVEQDLMQLIPKRHWIAYSHLLIYHGRAICRARRPDCTHCVLSEHCPSARL